MKFNAFLILLIISIEFLIGEFILWLKDRLK
jgi:hypothetical protein